VTEVQAHHQRSRATRPEPPARSRLDPQRTPGCAAGWISGASEWMGRGSYLRRWATFWRRVRRL